MRIVSLVPSATESLFALGLGTQVVAVTHECDFPPEALRLPRLTRSVIPQGLDPQEIDAMVREVTARGEPLYELDEEQLAAVAPDLIVTQALCAVCAVSFDDVRAVAGRLPSKPDVISLDPSSLSEVLDDLVLVAGATGTGERGERLRADLEARLDRVRVAVAGERRRRVVTLEWLAPPFAGGHWVPAMVETAGGRSVAGEPERDSRPVSWQELAAARPDVAVVMPCGMYAEEAAQQALDHRDELEALGAESIYAVDAASSFSRPGPRLIAGVELLGHLLHPERLPAPESLSFRDLSREIVSAVRT
jgi:iron complex transport system substrate-binding protein